MYDRYTLLPLDSPLLYRSPFFFSVDRRAPSRGDPRHRTPGTAMRETDEHPASGELIPLLRLGRPTGAVMLHAPRAGGNPLWFKPVKPYPERIGS